MKLLGWFRKSEHVVDITLTESILVQKSKKYPDS